MSDFTWSVELAHTVRPYLLTMNYVAKPDSEAARFIREITPKRNFRMLRSSETGDGFIRVKYPSVAADAIQAQLELRFPSLTPQTRETLLRMVATRQFDCDFRLLDDSESATVDWQIAIRTPNDTGGPSDLATLINSSAMTAAEQSRGDENDLLPSSLVHARPAQNCVIIESSSHDGQNVLDVDEANPVPTRINRLAELHFDMTRVVTEKNGAAISSIASFVENWFIQRELIQLKQRLGRAERKTSMAGSDFSDKADRCSHGDWKLMITIDSDPVENRLQLRLRVGQQLYGAVASSTWRREAHIRSMLTP